MIISPRGKVLARADGPDGLAVADIQPRGGREGGDAMNYQSDMRARLFRERNPEAFRILTDANPPALDNLPIDITAQECARIAARVLSVGEEEYRQAEALVRAGKIHDAITALENLQSTYRGSWIDRAAAERLHTLRGESGAMAWARIQPFFTPPPEYDNKLGDYRPVLRFDDSSPVNTPQDWPRRRAEILKYWHSVMGPWPPLVEKPGIVYEKQERVEDFTRHTVAIEVAPGRLVGPQYLLVPDGPGPFPAVLVTWYNSADSAGLNQEVRGTLDFGYQLAKRGFVALCVGGVNPPHPDLPDADRGGDGESRIQPLSYLAYVAANCCNALAHIPQVDAKRIGIVGHSFGGKWAMFASCLYERFSCAVWIDPGIVWNEQDPNANYWEKWYLGYQFDQPADQQRNEGVVTTDNPRTGAYKLLVEADHNLHELHALMAPRPFLVSGGAQDRPDHWTALNHAIGLNSFLGYSGRVAMTMRDGHTPTPESNAQVHDFLEFFLRE
jgi:dienelactone hydrolase